MPRAVSVTPQWTPDWCRVKCACGKPAAAGESAEGARPADPVADVHGAPKVDVLVSPRVLVIGGASMTTASRKHQHGARIVRFGLSRSTWAS